MLDFFKICGRITQVSGCSAGGSALEWGSRGREFESRHSDQILNPFSKEGGFSLFLPIFALLFHQLFLCFFTNTMLIISFLRFRNLILIYYE